MADQCIHVLCAIILMYEFSPHRRGVSSDFFFTLMVSDAGDWLEVTVLNTSQKKDMRKREKRHEKVCDQTLLDWLHILGHSTAKKHNGNTIDLL